MGNSLRLWARHMTLLFKELFWSPPHSKSILENLIHKYSLLLLWDTSHVIPFSFFFLPVTEEGVCLLLGSVMSTSPLGGSAVGPLFAWLVPSLHCVPKTE